MSGGLRGIKFAIPDEALANLVASRSNAFLDLRPLTPADAGRPVTFRLLPFSDEADEVEAYLKHDEIWFVIADNIDSPLLLWIPKETDPKFKNELRDDERLISLTSVIPSLGPTEEDELALHMAIEALLALGARRLSK